MAPSARAEHPLLQRLQEIRQRSEALIAGLEPEDLCLQGMADASPAKWHLGHTSWFFEQFLLQGLPGYEPADSRWGYLFNSYYEAVGERQPRPQRGLLTRPSIAEVLAWRRRVTAALEEHWEALDPQLLELGLQHEQQHQELLLMDLLDGFSRNPLEPAAFPNLEPELAYERSWRDAPSGPTQWIAMEGGLVEIGHGCPGGGDGFHFDNEAPRHRLWLEPFAIADRLVRNDDMAAFIDDGGYQRPELWM
ncbi:MAG: ergothioneine biosynthesis protein EgtB, partial [Synechococcaceae bacterium WBB_3_034]|nr:ergothioneine biosynthesis protein EgtB [Synechococcaceae bacterium WBB_3_034]